jgi:hypothetical protein
MVPVRKGGQVVGVIKAWEDFVFSLEPKQFEWKMPQQYDVSGVIDKWYKKYGERDDQGIPVFSIESTKAALQRSIAITSEMRTKVFLENAAGWNVNMEGVLDSECFRAFGKLTRQNKRLQDFKDELNDFDGESMEGAPESLRNKWTEFWYHVNKPVPYEGENIFTPQFAFPYVAINYCRVEIKAGEDALKGLMGLDDGNKYRPGDEGSAFLKFMTSPVGFGIVVLGGVLVARNLTK